MRYWLEAGVSHYTLLILLILCLNQYRKLMSFFRGCRSAVYVLILGLFIIPQRCNITHLKISRRFFFFKEIEIVHLQAQVVHKRTMANKFYFIHLSNYGHKKPWSIVNIWVLHKPRSCYYNTEQSIGLRKKIASRYSYLLFWKIQQGTK